MSEQSDAPRMDAAFEAVDQDCKSQFEWDGWKFARQLERALATAMRECDEARAALLAIELAAGSLADAQTIARKALAVTEVAPATPDGLPTYDKEKALEWVAQLRDGNKEPKP